MMHHVLEGILCDRSVHRYFDVVAWFFASLDNVDSFGNHKLQFLGH